MTHFDQAPFSLLFCVAKAGNPLKEDCSLLRSGNPVAKKMRSPLTGEVGGGVLGILEEGLRSQKIIVSSEISLRYLEF